MQPPAWLLVGLGGFLGSVLRYGASGAFQRLAPPSSGLPWGTFAVNTLGSLLIGLLAGIADGRGILSPDTRLFLMIGLLGGFTTFSTYSFESLQLLRSGQWGLALANVLGQLCVGLLAVWLGWGLGRLPGVNP